MYLNVCYKCTYIYMYLNVCLYKRRTNIKIYKYTYIYIYVPKCMFIQAKNKRENLFLYKRQAGINMDFCTRDRQT